MTYLELILAPWNLDARSFLAGAFFIGLSTTATMFVAALITYVARITE